VEIAPGFTADSWSALTFRGEQDWIRAVSALRKRLDARFLRPARSLLRLRRSGFAVLALDSLLVETLQQFREGVSETPRILRSGRFVLASEDYFKAFLTGPYFGTGFNEATAALFYRTIRCGILHQAEVKSSSLVRRDRPLVTVSPDGKGLVINPRLFHERVERAFRAYLADLRKPDNADLRRAFRAKMNHIARVGCGLGTKAPGPAALGLPGACGAPLVGPV
jgi:hypothetical protein